MLLGGFTVYCLNFICSLIFHRLEVALLLIVYIGYGFTEGGAVSFILLTVSSWFLVISWLFAPYIFNPSGFEWQKWVDVYVLHWPPQSSMLDYIFGFLGPLVYLQSMFTMLIEIWLCLVHLLFLLCMTRTVEDFDDWINWLLYKGGVGVKGDNSWESWWDEEQVCYNCFLWTCQFIFPLDVAFDIILLTRI